MIMAEDIKQQAGGVNDPPNHVHILDDRGHVDRDPVHVSKSAQEEVFWTNLGRKNASIVFDTKDGSPFRARDPFVLQPGERFASGCLDADKARVGKEFKYTVIGADEPNDPVVIIDK
jgi:hypothetical protein